MDGLSLALSIVATCDLCIKYGKALHSRCKSYHGAETELRELILKKNLPDRLQVHQNDILAVLNTKLQQAVKILDGLIGEKAQGLSDVNQLLRKSGETRRLKYATHAKESLNCLVDDLEGWGERFDPSWFLLARTELGEISQRTDVESDVVSMMKQLRLPCSDKHDKSSFGSVFLPPIYEKDKKKSIAFTSASMVRDASLVLDPIPVRTHMSVENTTKAVRDLARVLMVVDPGTFRLLKCRGLIKILDKSQKVSGFEFAFEIPPACKNPCGLRSLLLDTDHPITLTQRLGLAKSLARSVIYLHSAQIVHKNICPETVIIMKDASSSQALTPYLIGFQQFRFANSHTYMVGDGHWVRNLYRHPTRQGEHPEKEYQMQHDIYSLGVCLLEIGMWQSLIHYEVDSQKRPNMESAHPTSVLPIIEYLQLKDQRKKAFAIKRVFQSLAKDRLPIVMGELYADIVTSCLTCLDEDNNGFGDESKFKDEDGILIGVRYIEKILFKIERIVI